MVSGYNLRIRAVFDRSQQFWSKVPKNHTIRLYLIAGDIPDLMRGILKPVSSCEFNYGNIG
jgi:hypothetical protein